ncbi:MAG: T9SS type A sorting domain-containing protein, partial [bacterium]
RLPRGIQYRAVATGVKVAASKVNTPNIAPFENVATLNCVTLDMPSIGMSGNSIVIAYQGMIKNDTSSTGFNNNDIFIVQSNNGGATWSTPRNLTNTRGLDERFVSVAPWNEPGKVNLVWQEDPQAGGNIIGDPGATVNRTRQVFLKTTLTDVRIEDLLPQRFELSQNYPNPFNPATKIQYRLPFGADVNLTVYNTLGQQVATLVNGYRTAGSYEADFTGSNLASGVYYYTLRAGSFTQTKKMILTK